MPASASDLRRAVILAATALAFLLATVTTPAHTSAQQSWTVYFTPVIWASGIKGATGIGRQSARVDISFRQVLQRLDAALMLPTEVWHGRVGFGTEVIFTSLSRTPAAPGSLYSSASLKVGQFITEFAPRFRVIDTKRVTVDALGGIRYWSLKNSLTLGDGVAAGGDVSLDESWTDPYIGGRTFVTLANRWLVQLRGDVGGFNVGSKSSWQAMGLVDYRIGARATARAGYRQIDVNYDRNNYLYDVGIGGAFLGVTLAF